MIQSVIIVALSLALASCAKGSSCRQPVEGRATVINLTQNTVSVDIVRAAYDDSDEGRQEKAQAFVFAPGESVDVVFYRTERERAPLEKKKLDWSNQEDAECTVTAQLEEPGLSLTAASASAAGVQLCNSLYENKFYLVDSAAVCPLPVQ